MYKVETLHRNIDIQNHIAGTDAPKFYHTISFKREHAYQHSKIIFSFLEFLPYMSFLTSRYPLHAPFSLHHVA